MRRALLLALAACGETHVTLHEPAPNITAADRVAMFKALEGTSAETLEVSRNHGPWQLEGARMKLANGTKIELPEDLLPVVAPDSDTARAARASEDTGHRANTWLYISFGVLAASIATVASIESGSVNANISDEYLFAGAALATAIPFLVTRHLRSEELDLRMQAFSTYTRDLGLRLDVCAHGLEVVACEAPVVPAPLGPPGLTPPGGP